MKHYTHKRSHNGIWKIMTRQHGKGDKTVVDFWTKDDAKWKGFYHLGEGGGGSFKF